jgi:hypothetical protein
VQFASDALQKVSQHELSRPLKPQAWRGLLPPDFSFSLVLFLPCEWTVSPSVPRRGVHEQCELFALFFIFSHTLFLTAKKPVVAASNRGPCSSKIRQDTNWCLSMTPLEPFFKDNARPEVSPHPSPQWEGLLAQIRSDLQGFDRSLRCYVHPRLRSVFPLTQEKPPSRPLTRKTGSHTEIVKCSRRVIAF